MIAGNQKSGRDSQGILGKQQIGQVPGSPGPAFWITWAFGAIFAFIIVGLVTVTLISWGILCLAGIMLGGL